MGTWAIDAIPAYAFYGSAIINFELSNEITEIGDYAFANNDVLQSVAYGVNVSALAKLVGLNYINGANTVTYFGAIFY